MPRVRKPLARRRKPVARKSKRRAAGKRMGGFRIVRRIPMMAIMIQQATAGGFLATNTTVLKLGVPVAAQTLAANYWDVPFSVELHLSDLDSFTDITSISDKYKINAATLTFITNPGSYFGGAALPYIQIVPDYDDSIPPTLSILNQKMGLKTRTFNNIGMTSVRLTPKPSQTVGNGATNTSAIVPRSAPFLDCGHPDVPHFGLKGVFRNLYAPGTVAAVQNIALDISLSVSAKDLQ